MHSVAGVNVTVPTVLEILLRGKILTVAEAKINSIEQSKTASRSFACFPWANSFPNSVLHDNLITDSETG